MLRRIFTLIAAASLILGVISATLWFRSYSSGSRWETYQVGRLYSVRTVTGRFTMCWFEATSYMGQFGAPNGKSFNTALTRAETTYGFGLARSDWSDPSAASQLAVEFPMWFATAAFGVLPLLWILTRHRRRAAGFTCSRCGYNLTGNASGTCPECGTAVPESECAARRLSFPNPVESTS